MKLIANGFGFLAFLSVVHGHAPGQVIINEVLYNPTGDDIGNEKVELKNIGSVAVDLSEWELCTTLLYSGPGSFAGVVLSPGQLLTVHLATPGVNSAGNVFLPNFPPQIPGFHDGTLGNAADEISLYRCSPFCNFGGVGAENSMVDYVQWGVTGVGPNEERHNVAADPTRAGGALWSPAAAFDFAPVATEGLSIAFDGSNGAGGELTLGTDYHIRLPTLGQENSCFADADCNDNIACTDNRCMGGACLFVPNHALCASNNLFCDGAEVCQAGVGCVSSGSPCAASQICDETNDVCLACQTNAHCNDNDVCTIDNCENGTCSHMTLAGCCTTHAQCDDSDPCTTDTCANFTCSHVASIACQACATSADCEDGNPCTNGSCVQGVCQTTAVSGVCDDDDGCTTEDRCVQGACVGTVIEGCCMVDADCEDHNACTDDVCVDGRCSNTSIDDCLSCLLPGDCDDANPCTEDACVDGACEFENRNGPCDDGNLCTVEDNCRAGVCEGVAAVNCCTEDAQCDDADDCSTDECVALVCRHTPIADCVMDEPAGQMNENDNQASSGSGGSRGLCGTIGLIPMLALLTIKLVYRRR